MTSLPIPLVSINVLCTERTVSPTFDDWHDGTLLNRRRTLEAVRVDAAEEFTLEVHRIETVGGLIVVGLDLTWIKSQSI